MVHSIGRRFLAVAVVAAGGALAPALAHGASISSKFNKNLQGWAITGDAASGSPYWVSSGGNPGGFAQTVDAATGDDMIWVAPAKYLGNRAAYFGGTLSFDREVTPTSNYFTPPDDVTLYGDGTSVDFQLSSPPGPTWTTQDVVLVAKDTSDGTTKATLKAVLGDLTGLQIEAEYVVGNETDSLDNVVLATKPDAPAVAKPSFLRLAR